MSPEVEAIQKLIRSEGYKAMLDASGLGTSNQNTYLENRLLKAIQDGIEIGRRLERDEIEKRMIDEIQTRITRSRNG